METEKWVKVIIVACLVIAVLALFSCYALAQSTPLPVVGHISGVYDPDVLLIKATNLRTGVSMTTNPIGGYFLMEWANSGDKYVSGDKFKIIIVDCINNPVCENTVTYVGQSEIYVEYNLAGVISSCPPPSLDLNQEIIMGVLVLLFGTAGGYLLIKKYFLVIIKNGWGVRIYKSQDGKSVQVFHKHPGIVNYHNPDTEHRKVEIRHSKGKIF